MMMMLAWRPFIDPLDLHGMWFLFLIPLSLGIAVVYKAVRLRSMDRYWQNVVVMTGQIIVGMIALGALSYVVIQVVVPLLVPIEM